MIRIISFLAVISVCALALFIPARELDAGPAVVPGDADADGDMDQDDLSLITGFILARNTLPGNPDANDDGKVDVADIVAVRRALNMPELLAVSLSDTVAMDFVKIPRGIFLMGADDAGWSRPNEKPAHTVVIPREFYLARTEATRLHWHAVMGGTAPSDDEADLPVENVSWEDCVAFTDDMTQRGAGLWRLPSEAEWEYAARAGGNDRFSFGSSDCGSNLCVTCDLDQHAWWCGNNDPGGVKKVGLKTANPFKLFDMPGNLMEWCRDAWHETYDGAPADGSAWEEENAERRVLRGGYYDSSAAECRPAARSWQYYDGRDEPTGFRPVFIP